MFNLRNWFKAPVSAPVSTHIVIKHSWCDFMGEYMYKESVGLPIEVHGELIDEGRGKAIFNEKEFEIMISTDTLDGIECIKLVGLDRAPALFDHFWIKLPS